MKSIVSRRPSPALVVAMLALFVSMSGITYAAATIGSGQIKNNSVRGKDIRNSTVRGKDVGKNTLTGADVAESKLGKVKSAASADSAGNAGTVGGQSAASLALPRAYGYLDASAGAVALNAARSRGINGVTRQSTGTYCIDAAFDVSNVVATVEYQGGGGDTIVHASANQVGGVCPGADAIARTVDASTGAAVDSRDVHVQLH